MISVLQRNLQGGWTAQALLHQFVYEHRFDICILSEQHSSMSTSLWFSGLSGTATVWVINPDIHVIPEETKLQT